MEVQYRLRNKLVLQLSDPLDVVLDAFGVFSNPSLIVRVLDLLGDCGGKRTVNSFNAIYIVFSQTRCGLGEPAAEIAKNRTACFHHKCV